MNKFIILTFGVLGFAWYELSGGSDFEAGTLAQAPDVQVSPLQSDEDTVALDEAPEESVAVVAASLISTPTAAPTPAVPQPEPVIVAVEPTVDDTPNEEVAPVAEAEAEPVESPVLLTTRSEPEPVKPILTADIRYVTGSRVNLREGPGTSYGIAGKLSEGDEVEVLDTTGDGWLQVLTSDTGSIGWMADWLVTASN